MLTDTENFNLLERTISSQADYDVAMTHAPIIQFDAKEPFLPSAIGYTVFYETAESPSFPRTIEITRDTACVIEYAIWWDWDIQHLYELEHIWIYLDANNILINAEASWHGGFNRMVDDVGKIPTQDGRLILFSESGKHAFAPVKQWLRDREPITTLSCTTRSGVGGVLVTSLFDGVIKDRSPISNQLVHTYLERHAFEPTYDFAQKFALSDAVFVQWESLNAWIPKRVSWWVEELARTIPFSERRVLRIAHRGASAYAQENSPEALEKAAELGSDMVEVDLRITTDDMPVIAHDDSLKRVYGIDGNISELTLSELQEKAPIMTFEALANKCRSFGMGVYLDIKALSPKAAERMFEVVDRTGFIKGIIFASFRVDFVADLKAHRPDILTSILFGATHVQPVALAEAVNADFVHPCWESRHPQPHKLLTEAWLSEVRKANLGIITWHEERPDEIAALKALGVNGICSDQPDLLK